MIIKVVVNYLTYKVSSGVWFKSLAKCKSYSGFVVYQSKGYKMRNNLELTTKGPPKQLTISILVMDFLCPLYWQGLFMSYHFDYWVQQSHRKTGKNGGIVKLGPLILAI